MLTHPCVSHPAASVGRSRSLPVLRSRFGSLYVFAAVFVAASLGLRTALLVSSLSKVDASFAARALGAGLVNDVLACACCVAPLVVWLLLVPGRVLRWRVAQWVAIGAYYVGVLLICLDVTAEWLFWREFGCRFNFIAVDYLVYTQEVIGNVAESYPAKVIVAVCVLLAGGIVWSTRRALLLSYHSPSRFWRRLGPAVVWLSLPAVALALPVGRWPRPSGNRYNDELAKNGLVSLVEAFRANRIDYDTFYMRRDEQPVFARLRELLAGPGEAFVDDSPTDITRRVTAAGPTHKYNVILLTVESLSARFLGAFDGPRGLTPRLDALVDQGLLLTHAYAAGTRTTRGLEAIVTSLPPTPGRSIVKRPGHEKTFSLTGVLRREGYDATFLYGGNGYFDNMNSFFEANGCRIVDEKSLAPDEVTFKTAWGVCDEDIFHRSLAEADKAFARGGPFFQFIMTTSNHRPYTYPQKVAIPSGTGREGAVQYTDYAIGKFLDAARGKPWFDRTLFVIVADHCANSAGKMEVPVIHYHIPILFYAPKIIKPGRCDALCSQIDVAPTLLGLLGLSYDSRFYGKDVLRDPPGRALLGTYQKLGLYRDGVLTVLAPNEECTAYRIGPSGEQTPVALQTSHLFDTIVYYQSASYLLKHRLLGGP